MFLLFQLDPLDQLVPEFLVFLLHLVNHYFLNSLEYLVYQYFQLDLSDQFHLALLVYLVFRLDQLNQLHLAYLVYLVFRLDQLSPLDQAFLVYLVFPVDQLDLFHLEFLEHLEFPVDLVPPLDLGSLEHLVVQLNPPAPLDHFLPAPLALLEFLSDRLDQSALVPLDFLAGQSVHLKNQLDQLVQWAP